MERSDRTSYLYFKLKDEINELAENTEFKRRLVETTDNLDFDKMTKRDKVQVATKQENLFIEYSKPLTRSDDQRASGDNLVNGDLRFVNDYYIDLKVSSRDYISTVSSLSKNTIEKFRVDGYYLVCSLDFTKRLLLPRNVVARAVKQGILQYDKNKYIKGMDLWDTFSSKYSI